VVIALLLVGLALSAMMNLHVQQSAEQRAQIRDQHFILEMDRLGQVSHDMQRHNERLSVQYSRAEQLLRDSEQMRDSLNNEVAAYKAKLQAAEAKLVAAEQEKEQAKLHIQQKQGLLADLQAELDSLKREVTELASACEPDEAEGEAEEEVSTKEVHSTHPEGFTWVHQRASPHTARSVLLPKRHMSLHFYSRHRRCRSVRHGGWRSSSLMRSTRRTASASSTPG
jgi:predicted  nucleic acid-binding Zn-ribbon protein